MTKSIAILSFLLISFNALMAQEESDCKCPSGVRVRVFKHHPPRFLDSSLFLQDLKEKLDLKLAFDKQKQDSLIYFYIYHFDVDTKGKVQSKYSHNNWPMTHEIEVFINEKFNNYKWEPGYKKKCKRCVKSYYMTLGMYLERKTNNITVSIKMVGTPGYKMPQILNINLPYESLKSF